MVEIECGNVNYATGRLYCPHARNQDAKFLSNVDSAVASTLFASKALTKEQVIRGMVLERGCVGVSGRDGRGRVVVAMVARIDVRTCSKRLPCLEQHNAAPPPPPTTSSSSSSSTTLWQCASYENKNVETHYKIAGADQLIKCSAGGTVRVCVYLCM